MRRIPLFVPAIMIVFTGIAIGQTTSGDLVGTVKDPLGAFIVNANLTITNEQTGVAVSTKAGTSGEFRANNRFFQAITISLSIPQAFSDTPFVVS